MSRNAQGIGTYVEDEDVHKYTWGQTVGGYRGLGGGGRCKCVHSCTLPICANGGEAPGLTASAAHMNMGSRTRVDSDRISPSPKPGKMYAEVLGRGAAVRPSSRGVHSLTSRFDVSILL